MKWTISLLLIAVLLISIAILVDPTDNPPMVAMFLIGIIVLFFAVLHPWKKAGNYGILAGVCISILLLELITIHILSAMHLDEHISEGIAMGVAFLICVPGILTGIIGAIICAVRNNKTLQRETKCKFRPSLTTSKEGLESLTYFRKQRGLV